MAPCGGLEWIALYGEALSKTVVLHESRCLVRIAKGIKQDPRDLLRLLILLIPLPVQEDQESQGVQAYQGSKGVKRISRQG
jgi:hypothetical protein